MLPKRWISPLLILGILIAGIFVAEVIAMIAVRNLDPRNYLLTTLIDATIMVVLIFPLCYFMVFRGLVHQLYGRLLAERELQQTIKTFERLFSTTHVLFAYMDANFNFMQVNRAYAEGDGREPDFFPGKNHFDLYPDADNEAIFRKVIETGEPFFVFEKPFTYVEHPERGDTYWDWSLEPVKDQDGRVTGLILGLTDRTQQKREQLARARAEEVLRRNEELLRHVLAALPVGVWISDPDGKTLSANPAAQRIWGGHQSVGRDEYSRYQAWHMDTGLPVRPEDWPLSYTLQTGQPCLEQEFKIRSFDGKEKIVLHSSVPIVIDGEIQSVIMLNIDVTERRAEQRSLELERNKLESILNAMPEGVYIAGQDYRIEYINPVLLNTFGAVNGRLCYQYFHDRENPCPWCENERVFSGESIIEEYTYPKIGRTYDLYSTSITNADGHPSKLKIFHDITERRQAQVNLERSIQELQTSKEAEHRARLTAEVFASASQAFTQSLEMDAVFNQMLAFLQQLAPYDRAHVLLLEDDTRFSTRAVYPTPPDDAPASSRQQSCLIASYPYLVELLIKAQPVLIANTASYPQWRYYADAPVDAWLGVPLLAGGSLIGFLGMARSGSIPFSPENARLAEALVSQAATALQNAWLFEQVRAAGERLQSLSRHLVDVQESERRHIARELHDESGQMLTSIMVNLQLMEKHADDPDYVIAKAAEIGAYLQSALKNLQQLAMSLRPATLDHLGLAPTLRQFAQITSEKRGLNVQFKAVGIDDRLPTNIETTLYRVVQESINNVIRHARATQADILLQSRQGKLILIVEDNGIGFNPSAVDELKHSGIFGMRERVEMLGGVMTIESEPGQGTTLHVELPYDYQNPDR